MVPVVGWGGGVGRGEVNIPANSLGRVVVRWTIFVCMTQRKQLQCSPLFLDKTWQSFAAVVLLLVLKGGGKSH